MYIDDIVIFGDNKLKVLDILDEILLRCCREGFAVKLGKSEFLKSEIAFLGHIIGAQGITSDPKKVKSVQEALPLKNKDELRAFLGTVGYLRRFIPHFAEIVLPLTELTKKGTTFEWSESCSGAFEWLKEELSAVVLLSAPLGNGPFVIVSDALNYGLGNALLQVQGKELVLLEFGSKKLSPSEKKWDTREKEAFGIKWSVEHYQDYIKAGKTLVLTDHESLRWIDNSQNDRVQRWALFLQQFDLKIIHIPGMTNLTADWLSRSLPDEEFDVINQIGIPVFASDAVAHKLVSIKSCCPRVPRPEDFKLAYQGINEDELRDVTMGKDGFYYSLKTGRLYVPVELREALMFWFHTSRYGGHSGVGRTVRRMQQFVWWRGMHQDTMKYISCCLPCKRHHPPITTKTFHRVLSKPLPMQVVSLDFVGPRVWGCKKVYYIVALDHASRFLMAKQTLDLSGKEVLSFFKEHWLAVFQAPEAVLSDRGSAFTGTEWTSYITNEVCAYVVYTSPYYPQGNSINESAHRALETSLQACESDFALSFADALQDAVTVHNASPHPATGESPYCFLFGIEPTLPGWQPYAWNHPDQLRKAKLRELRYCAIIRNRLDLDDQLKMKDHVVSLKPGDWVVFTLSEYERKTTKANDREPKVHKFLAGWSLPAKVVKVKDKVCYVQELGKTQEPRQVPLSQTRKLEGPIPPTLVQININHIKRENPRFVKAKVVKRMLPDSGKSWEDVVNESQVGARRPIKLKRSQESTA